MSTHSICICCGYPQHMFLWRNKLNYPRIITKYSSLTIPLLHVSELWTELQQKGGVLAIPFKRHQILAHRNESDTFCFRRFQWKKRKSSKMREIHSPGIYLLRKLTGMHTLSGEATLLKKMPTFWKLVYTKGKNLLLCGSKFFPFRLDPFLEANWGE